MPVSPQAHPDTASNSDRQARDDHWARLFPAPTDKYSSALPIIDTFGADQPEFLQISGSFWAIATFSGYDLHEVPVNGVYTEIHFRVDRIVTSPASTTPQVGETIDVDLVGGTVQKPSGEIYRCVGFKAEWPSTLNPGGRYLIQFYPVSPGNFYQFADYYDLSTGVARAASSKAWWFAHNGKSHVDGLSEADAVTYIQQLPSRK
jgi:hypothetical protein